MYERNFRKTFINVAFVYRKATLSVSSKLLEKNKIFSAIDESKRRKLEDLTGLLRQWNKIVNLISRKDIENLDNHHILPCLALNAVIPLVGGESVCDVGTGGGLPGLPLAILNPQSQFTLIDSNKKKIDIVKNFALDLQLNNVICIAGRAEAHTKRYDFLIGRAVSNLPNFLQFSAHLADLKSHVYNLNSLGIALGPGLFYIKGGEFSNEIKDAGLKQTQLFSVQKIANVESDKSVLYVPSMELGNFLVRQFKKRY